MGNCQAKKKNPRRSTMSIKSPTKLRGGCALISSKSSLPISFRTFLKLHFEPMRHDYKTLELLGTGSFSEVRRCQHLPTGQFRAVKRIFKDRLDPEQYTSMRILQEMDIMRGLDHPSILRVFDFYEDKSSFYIVSELCQGGQLLDRINSKKPIPEKEASQIMRQLFSAILYCHRRDITHRDLKPENLLLQDQSALSLKVADFGCSVGDSFTDYFTGCIGTAYYMAPEVAAGKYTKSCDIWSAGIIMYVLLTGLKPYKGQTRLIERIKEKPFQPKGRHLKNMSSEARNLLISLLDVDHNKRISAEAALSHKWIEQFKDNVSDCSEVLGNIKRIKYSGKLSEAVRVFMASQLIGSQSLSQIKNAFLAIDTNGDGKLSRSEIKDFFMDKMDENSANSETERFMGLFDSDKNGEIAYSEFIQAGLDEKWVCNPVLLEYAFKQFDFDDAGFVDAEKLREVLQGSSYVQPCVWDEILTEADENQDGQLDFEEFSSFMNKTIKQNI